MAMSGHQVHRLNQEEKLRRLAEYRGDEWLKSILRPCHVSSVSKMSDAALRAAIAVWDGNYNPPQGVVAK